MHLTSLCVQLSPSAAVSLPFFFCLSPSLLLLLTLSTLTLLLPLGQAIHTLNIQSIPVTSPSFTSFFPISSPRPRTSYVIIHHKQQVVWPYITSLSHTFHALFASLSLSSFSVRLYPLTFPLWRCLRAEFS